MEFIHTDLNHLQGGTVVEVTISLAANVRVMDAMNFNAYRNGRSFRSYGGYYKTSPVRIAVPHNGHWHLAIDLGGGSGNIRTSVRTIS